MNNLAFPQVFTQLPTQTSHRNNWNNISLEHHMHEPGETSECCLNNYVISILLSQNIYAERRVSGERNIASAHHYGAISILPHLVPHWHCWKNKINVIILNLNPTLLTQNALELLDVDQVDLQPHFSVYDPLILQIGLALWSEIKSQNNTDQLYGDSMANALVVHLLKKFAIQKKQIAVYSGGLTPNKLKLVTDYINDNLEQNLSLGELASCAQLSQYHFSRAFKKSQGISPHQYVIQQRVEKAKQLLKENKMSTAEIAIACGFANQSHLHRHFKHMTGVTPRLFLTS